MTAAVEQIAEVLADLDEMNAAGRIAYADYSRLHDAVAALGGGDGEVEWGVRIPMSVRSQTTRDLPQKTETSARRLAGLMPGRVLLMRTASRVTLPGPWVEVTDEGGEGA